MRILVTGGAGYIGSHAILELIRTGFSVIAMDNLSNSKSVSLQRVEEMTDSKIPFYHVDLLDSNKLDSIFEKHNIDAVIHFAGLKAVGESVEHPLRYYQNNVCGTVNLCRVMNRHSVKKLVFSSSATVYGNPSTVPIREDAKLSAVNPYGRSKLTIEYMLKELYESDNDWRISILRYFNPVGADESGKIGEDPNGIPNNLMPYLTKVAAGRLPELTVFGDDYETDDGTGIRDYIHVTDLVLGHLSALEYLKKQNGIEIFNLGTGRGFSVIELIRAFEQVNDIQVPFKIGPRRPGDIAQCYADPGKAADKLCWSTDKTVQDMCRDAWRWQVNNPDGY